jgi:hypothetical protein
VPVDSRDSAPSAGTTTAAKLPGAPTLSLRLSTTFSPKNLRSAAATRAACTFLSGTLPVSVNVEATGSL